MPHDDDSTISLHRPVSGDEAAATVEIPKAIGSLELVQELGKGGMGVVWLARDTILSRDVAVKFLIGSAANPADPHFTQFVQGAKAAAQVRSEGLTAIHHADLVQGIPYLVMEYIAGPSLSEVLRAGGPMPVNAAVWVVGRVCETLAMLHDSEVVHRDIKPGNILMDAVRGPVVTDFGLSLDRIHAMGRGIDVGDRVAGTPEYMAPEMWSGEVSARTDVYALGVTLFELLAGAKPFKGSIPALRNAHAVLPPPLSDLASRQVPQDLMDVIDRAMHKDAKLRYRGPRRLAEALLQVVPGEQARRQGESHVNEIAARLRSPTKPAWDSQVYTVPQTRTPSTYYERLGQIASKRRTHQADDAEPAPPPTPPAGSDQAVDRNTPCVTCGYNLRHLAVGGRCPECGGSIKPSLDPSRLVLADRRWLGRLRIGLVSLIALPAIGMVVGAVATILVVGQPRPGRAAQFMTILTAVVIASFMAGATGGIFWATIPPPNRSLAPAPRLAFAARVLAGLGVLLVLAGVSAALIGNEPTLENPWMQVAELVMNVMAIPLALYLAALIGRADRPRATRIAGWLATGLSGLTAASVFGQLLVRGAPPSSWWARNHDAVDMAVGALASLSLIMLILATIGYITAALRTMRGVGGEAETAPGVDRDDADDSGSASTPASPEPPARPPP